MKSKIVFGLIVFCAMLPLGAMADSDDIFRIGPAHLGMSSEEFNTALAGENLEKCPTASPGYSNFIYKRSVDNIPGFGNGNALLFTLKKDGSGHTFLNSIGTVRGESVAGNPTLHIKKVADQIATVFGASEYKDGSWYFPNKKESYYLIFEGKLQEKNTVVMTLTFFLKEAANNGSAVTANIPVVKSAPTMAVSPTSKQVEAPTSVSSTNIEAGAGSLDVNKINTIGAEITFVWATKEACDAETRADSNDINDTNANSQCTDSLSKGAKVRVIEQSGAYCKIVVLSGSQITDGKGVGWIPTSKLALP